MTAPQTSSPTRDDPVPAAWLAGGLPRALDTLLVSRLEARRIRVVDGQVEDLRLDRRDPLDGALLDALGARGRRDVGTVLWRVSRDRRLDRIRVDLTAGGLLGGRTRLGLPATATRPAPTAAGRRLLRDLRAVPHAGAAWEVALGGRPALGDRTLREALEPRRPAADVRIPRRSRLDPFRDAGYDAHRYGSGGAIGGGIGGWGGDCGGFGNGGGGGGDGGGC